jgi:hypothetical protein
MHSSALMAEAEVIMTFYHSPPAERNTKQKLLLPAHGYGARMLAPMSLAMREPCALAR